MIARDSFMLGYTQANVLEIQRFLINREYDQALSRVNEVVRYINEQLKQSKDIDGQLLPET